MVDALTMILDIHDMRLNLMSIQRFYKNKQQEAMNWKASGDAEPIDLTIESSVAFQNVVETQTSPKAQEPSKTVKRPNLGAGTVGNLPGLSPHVGVRRPYSKPPDQSPHVLSVTPHVRTSASSSSIPQVPPPPPSWNPTSVASVNWLGNETSPGSKSKPIVIDDDSAEALSPRQKLFQSLMCAKRQRLEVESSNPHIVTSKRTFVANDVTNRCVKYVKHSVIVVA